MKVLISSLLMMAGASQAVLTSKPAPIMDEDLHRADSKCTKKMFECSDEPKNNPRASPNLKINNDIWYEMEGYWVGTMRRFNADGTPGQPEYWSENAPVKAYPYPKQDIKYFMNLTVRETRLFKHDYMVYGKAPADFCEQDSGDITLQNSIPPSICGDNGYVSSGSKYGVANWTKDGVAELFAANGVLHSNDDSELNEVGDISSSDDSSIVFSVSGKTVEESETIRFNNAARTRLYGSGVYSTISDASVVAAADSKSIKETYTFDVYQVTKEDFINELAQAQADVEIVDAGLVSAISGGDCFDYIVNGCPSTEDYIAIGDPAVTSSPYDDDSRMRGAFIFMFCFIGFIFIVLVGYYLHHRRMETQSDRYKHQFARRIAQTIEFSGTLQEVTPEALEKEFKRIDEAGNGAITKEELRHFMGENMNARDFNALFAALDVDHNGTVDFEEFCAFMVHVGSMPDIKNEKIIDADEGDNEGEGEHEKDHLNRKFDDAAAESEEKHVSYEKHLMCGVVFLTLCVIGLLIGIIVLAVQDDEDDNNEVVVESTEPVKSNVPQNENYDIETIFKTDGVNMCEGANPKWANVDCIHLEGPGPQSGANVTKGFTGSFDVSGAAWGDLKPQSTPYWQSSMCPVNVHWHLGTEHYSVGEFDEFGKGPNGNAPAPTRRLAAGEGGGQEFNVRGGFRCHHYDENSARFTEPFEWKHCLGMQVGETYEVHWPHSAVGACGTVHQYQTPFYDGVFCKIPGISKGDLVEAVGDAQGVADRVGVQGQIFTIVNDEKYFYPDLIRGWIVDESMSMGTDVTMYTGSTTGTSRNNDICSDYTPITWKVDRKCHLISASSFDKLCYDMKQQLDDMADDLYAHGSRLLVNSSMVANNQEFLGDRRNLRH